VNRKLRALLAGMRPAAGPVPPAEQERNGMSDVFVTWYFADGSRQDPGITAILPEDAGIEIPPGVLKWARRNARPDDVIFVGLGDPGSHGLEPRSFGCICRFMPEGQAALVLEAVRRSSEP